MSYPTVFGNLAAGNQPASLFDTMFNIAGQQGNIPCTASGTNTITLTPNTNYYLPTSYTNAQQASFKAVATSSGAVTLQIGGLGLINLYTAAGVQANSGDVVLNSHYAVQYWGDLNSGAGGFIILNATVTSIAQPVQGSEKNVSISVTANTQVVVQADACIVQNASGGTARVTTVNVTVSAGTSGANGLDTGTFTGPNWYAVFIIYNAGASTIAGLISLSASSPTLPSGYTYFARVGWVRADSNPYFYRTLQFGRDAQYVITASTNTAQAVIIASATAGTYSTTAPTLATVTIKGTASCVCPPTASKINVSATTSWEGSAASGVLVAPNASWGGANNGPEGSNGNLYPIWMVSGVAASSSAWITIEANSLVAWASAAAGGAIGCIGWQDNL